MFSIYTWSKCLVKKCFKFLLTLHDKYKNNANCFLHVCLWWLVNSLTKLKWLHKVNQKWWDFRITCWFLVLTDEICAYQPIYKYHCFYHSLFGKVTNVPPRKKTICQKYVILLDITITVYAFGNFSGFLTFFKI